MKSSLRQVKYCLKLDFFFKIFALSFKIFCDFANIPFHIKWGIKWIKYWVAAQTLTSSNSNFYVYLEHKNISLVTKFIFQLFDSHDIHNVVSTLANVIKIGVENDNILLTLSNIKAEIHNIDSILFNVVNLSVDVYIIISTLIWRYPTLRPSNNVELFVGKLTIKTQEQRQWSRSGDFIVNFENTSRLFYYFYCWFWNCKCVVGKKVTTPVF